MAVSMKAEAVMTKPHTTNEMKIIKIELSKSGILFLMRPILPQKVELLASET